MDLLGARTLRWTTQMVSLGWRSLSSEVRLLAGAGVVGGRRGGGISSGDRSSAPSKCTATLPL